MSEYHRPDATKIQALNDMAFQLRIDSVRATTASNSGHPTSCSSAAEIMSVLFFNNMRYKISEPRDPASDRFVMSKGHAAPILYAAWAEAGLFPASDLLNLRKIDSDLEGHPTPRLNFVDVATGSLGQGLSCACGMAYTTKYFDKSSCRVFTLMGDGEVSEGSVWEAAAFASYYKLDNLVAIVDVNRLGQSQAAPLEHDMETFKKRWEAFGFTTYVVDGHNVEELCKVLSESAVVEGKPTAIMAKTFKGKYFLDMEDKVQFHGKPMGANTDKLIAHLQAMMSNKGPTNLSPQPVTDTVPTVCLKNIKLKSPPNFTIGEKVATRTAYGTGLARLDSDRIVGLDGDTKNSTFSDKFMKEHPDRFIECFIAEQNLVGVGIGCATRDRMVAFCSTFAAFFTRAFDQIRMGAISQTNCNFAGSHAGISIGEDGPSQMALEDLAMFRAVAGSTVFYPSDAVSCERAVEICANTKGICFIRTGRSAHPVIYKNDEVFSIGSAKVVRESANDVITVIGAGITLAEALVAADKLGADGISIRVVDPFTIKPLDVATIVSCAKATGGRILTVEDHYADGGIGDAVSAGVSKESGITVHRLAVSGVPRSGPSGALLDMFGISASAIEKTIRNII